MSVCLFFQTIITNKGVCFQSVTVCLKEGGLGCIQTKSGGQLQMLQGCPAVVSAENSELQ